MKQQRLLIVLIIALLTSAITFLNIMPLQLGLDLKGGSQLTIQLKPTEDIKNISQEDLEAAKTVLENRVNGLGVAEPIVQTLGKDKIVIQLPGVTNPEQAERVLGGTAQLDFQEQRKGTEGQLSAEFKIRQQKNIELNTLKQKKPDLETKKRIVELVESIDVSNQAILKLFDPAGLSGKNLKNARYGPSQGIEWQVIIDFDNEGEEKFANLTKQVAGTGRSIGIFLDNILISAPVVCPQFAVTGITGGSAVITGNFTAESANEMAVQLRGGSLPFPVEVVENRTVGATLGQDSVRRSIYATATGLILVLIFMIVYYRLSGVLANIALLIYAALTLACYSLIGVTLTLPGIAGFILSIGMAVDANILVFERIREELQNGKTLYTGVESGFYRAFSSILDSNITTLIACGALFSLGSGLVKGFALTLAIGVLISMFTALTCTRTLLLTTVLKFSIVRKNPAIFCPNLFTTSKF